MRKIFSYKLFVGLAIIFPIVALAAGPTDLEGVINIFFELLAKLIPVVFTLAMVGFLWGVAIYIFKSDDETARKEGRKFMLYGIIALFVMFAVMGLIGILGLTFGVTIANPF